MLCCRSLRCPEFFPHIAGKIFVFRLPCLGFRIKVDHAGQFFCYRIFVFSGQLCHIRQIHPRLFSYGYCQCFCRGVRMRNGLWSPNSTLGEHIRFAFEFSIFIQHFKRTEQIIRRIIRKCESVRPIVNQPEFSAERIILPVQLPLFVFNCFIISIFQLSVH